MSVQILHDTRTDAAALFCNTTDWAFGPVFTTPDQAESFLIWLDAGAAARLSVPPIMGTANGRDPRQFSDNDLERLYHAWVGECLDDEGTLTDEALQELEAATGG